MRPTRLQIALAFVLGFALVTAGALLAQDSTAVTDKTGLFGPVIDALFPVAVTLLTSLTVKIVSAANAAFARTPPVVKYLALYAFALLYNQVAGWLGITALDPLAPAMALSLVQTVAAALVYRFGRHAPPIL